MRKLNTRMDVCENSGFLLITNALLFDCIVKPVFFVLFALETGNPINYRFQEKNWFQRYKIDIFFSIHSMVS